MSKGPKSNNNTKLKNPISPRGSIKNTSDHEQYDEDDGCSPTDVGSSDMQDEQFDSHLQDSPESGKLGSKSSGGKPHAAAAIMREVARASMKQPGPDQEYQGSKKVSSPKSKSQSKSYDASSDENPQARSKTQLSQKIPKK